MKIDNKVFVVTGAGSGIGAALVAALLDKGAKVAAVDMREKSLQQLQDKHSSKKRVLSTHVCDISDSASVNRLPEEILRVQPSIDCIINNAGIIQPFVKIADLEDSVIDKVMQVNWWGTLRMVRTFLPYLQQQPESHIVNISSMGGFVPVPGQSIYGASKAAVKLLTEGLYAELIDSTVGVTLVFPGAIDTNITQNSGVKIDNLDTSSTKGSASQVLPAPTAAKQIISAIERNKLYVYVGRDSKAINLLYRLHPRFATNMIAKKMKSLLGDN